MDAFSYLSVLLSIILGLGITHLLAALGRLIVARSGVVWYWPPLLWTVVLLLIHVQVWWAMFGLRQRASWRFIEFVVVLSQIVTLYMAAALVLPEHAGGATASRITTERTELRAHYERQTPWFFGFLGATVLVSLLKEVTLEGRLPMAGNLVFHVFLLAISVLAIGTRRRLFHEVLAVAVAVSTVAYIGALFSRLQ